MTALPDNPFARACEHFDAAIAALQETDIADIPAPDEAQRLREAVSRASSAVIAVNARLETDEPLPVRREISRTQRDTGVELGSVQQIADMYPVSEVRLYAAVREGVLPCIKFGRKILLRRPVVEAWMLTLEQPHPFGRADEVTA